MIVQLKQSVSSDIYENSVVFVVKLSDGNIYFSDNDQPPAWIRLKKYLKESGLKIINMQLRFRSHIIDLPEKAEGYYFANGIIASLNSSKNCNIVGILNKGVVECIWFSIPELEPMKKENKLIEEIKEPFIIINRS
jgi:hypothetical protein